MSALPKPALSFDDFLEWELEQETKHEYYRGEVFAMAGGSATHARIIGNAFFALRQAVQGRGCAVYTDALGVRIMPANLYTYPDLSVVCGDEEFYGERETALLNPLMIAEVLSPSTAEYDLTTKRGLYARIPSLEAYVIIEQRAPGVEVYSRSNGVWRVDRVETGAAPIPCLDVALPLEALYDGVAFPGPEKRTRPTPGV